MSQQQTKVALVSGANKGIGLETSRQLGKLGTTVLLGARDLAKGEKAAGSLRSEGIDAHAVQLDVTKQADIAALAARIEKDFGKLDVLVNNAGLFVEQFGQVNTSATITQSDLRATFETNFFAVVAVTQALLPMLRKAPAARIVNISSWMGSQTLQSSPDAPIYDVKVFAYNSSKSALNNFTIHLAHALRDTKIKVNSAHPGWVKTDMGGLDAAPMEVTEGAKTGVTLATLPEDGVTGSFVHLGETLPW